MEDLKPVLSKYIQTTKRLSEMNAEIAEVRDTKRTLELDLAAELQWIGEKPEALLFRRD